MYLLILQSYLILSNCLVWALPARPNTNHDKNNMLTRREEIPTPPRQTRDPQLAVDRCARILWNEWFISTPQLIHREHLLRDEYWSGKLADMDDDLADREQSESNHITDLCSKWHSTITRIVTPSKSARELWEEMPRIKAKGWMKTVSNRKMRNGLKRFPSNSEEQDPRGGENIRHTATGCRSTRHPTTSTSISWLTNNGCEAMDSFQNHASSLAGILSRKETHLSQQTPYFEDYLDINAEHYVVVKHQGPYQ
ncbi:MAG: hypothetical protein M1816_003254 [Peltula sp. TS41687]|nr:MAG: hypothetical protein M1816_003254 [Peltula sp. TS41687]